ncbi:MAG: nitroreductase family protein [Rhodospirillaceae bacterium]|nr:nitroreductase family protein [Rhodospirillaceae bacterium]MBT6205582.1 nitroreductase family protein [Rhodospirillaceae bacterium]MBT6509668.1 nitroreductase family protein [Rhodospirillaceae bacterium]MBT7646234.1 nitroreductase family protein [Rhodospirillaceae bacterium]
MPLAGYPPKSDEALAASAEAFRWTMATRRTVREFSDQAVPRAVIETCLAAAHRAPSGANQQPWHFAMVGDGAIKRRLREAAEEEERSFYSGRAPDDWLQALAPLGTDSEKPFLETAPWLIAVFGARYGVAPDGSRTKHYYVPESVCLAAGFLLCALHHAGLATLTHTPSPMGFLNEVLERPENEKPYLLIVTGHPADDCRVPAIEHKPLEAVASWF